jgi:hypothetical protein
LLSEWNFAGVCDWRLDFEGVCDWKLSFGGVLLLEVGIQKVSDRSFVFELVCNLRLGEKRLYNEDWA